MAVLILYYCAATQAEESSNLSFSDKTTQKYQLYYLTIGSQHYNSKLFRTIQEATSSAKKIAEEFRKIGGKGIEVLSQSNNPISRDKILESIYDVKRIIRHDNPENPLLIFYYMGHGLGDNFSTSYLVPGDYEIEQEYLSEIDRKQFASKLIEVDELAIHFWLFSIGDKYKSTDKELLYQDITREIYSASTLQRLGIRKGKIFFVEELEHSHSHVPYLIILDKCSDQVASVVDEVPKLMALGYNKEFQTELSEAHEKENKTNETDDNIKDKIIHKWVTNLPSNRCKKSLEVNCVRELEKEWILQWKHDMLNLRKNYLSEYGSIFISSTPGDKSYPVGDNEFTPNSEKIGVLARRFILAIENSLRLNITKPISLGAVLKQVESEKLDSQSEPPFSFFSPPDEMANKILISK